MSYPTSQPDNRSAPRKIRNHFERAVFLAVYCSPRQRLHRAIVRPFLGPKQVLRRVLSNWPLYLQPLFATLLQASYLPLIALLLLAGLAVPGLIPPHVVREDYARFVGGCMLEPGYPARLLFSAVPRS